jgi:hypothetical protein
MMLSEERFFQVLVAVQRWSFIYPPASIDLGFITFTALIGVNHSSNGFRHLRRHPSKGCRHIINLVESNIGITFSHTSTSQSEMHIFVIIWCDCRQFNVVVPQCLCRAGALAARPRVLGLS